MPDQLVLSGKSLTASLTSMSVHRLVAIHVPSASVPAWESLRAIGFAARVALVSLLDSVVFQIEALVKDSLALGANIMTRHILIPSVV